MYTVARKATERAEHIEKSRFGFFRKSKTHIIDHSEVFMKYYDARIIEGCCVFSYEVKTPDRSAKKGGKRKKADKNASWKKALLRFILLLLLPFAFLSECAEKLITEVPCRLHKCLRECFRCKELTACILSAVSASALIPLALLLL